jgi:methylthioribose-1-phosphate isomerase
MSRMKTIEWKEGAVITIDQSKLPNEVLFLKLKDCREVALAIREMKMRGAPLLGAAAAYGLALSAFHSTASSKEDLMEEMEESAEMLRKTRPTAVNLFWAIDRVIEKARRTAGDAEAVAKVIVTEAQEIADEDVEANHKIGEHGSALIQQGDRILTHCNAGSLATVDYGTALGVIRAAWEQGKRIQVFSTETRPKMQGSRLTTYELKRDAIPVTLITDNMVGYVMSRNLVDKVVVGADRIVRDAVINKMGTYTVAVLAHEHGVPFYVAAPTSTFDSSSSASEVTIEQRDPKEVTHIMSRRVAPRNVKALNPAFDVTPMKYVTAIICETGVLSPAEFRKLIKD